MSRSSRSTKRTGVTAGNLGERPGIQLARMAYSGSHSNYSSKTRSSVLALPNKMATFALAAVHAQCSQRTAMMMQMLVHARVSDIVRVIRIS